MPEYFECAKCKSKEFHYKESGELMCIKCDCHYALILRPEKPLPISDKEYKPSKEN